MPTYTVELDGKRYKIAGDRAPSEAEARSAIGAQSAPDTRTATAPPSFAMMRGKPSTAQDFPTPDQMLNLWPEVGPKRVALGARDVMQGNVSRGLNTAMSGAVNTVAPVAAPAALAGLAVAPVATAGILGRGMAAQWLGQRGAQAAGLTPDQSELVGNVTGVASGSPKVGQMMASAGSTALRAAPKVIGATARAIPDDAAMLLGGVIGGSYGGPLGAAEGMATGGVAGKLLKRLRQVGVTPPAPAITPLQPAATGAARYENGAWTRVDPATAAAVAERQKMSTAKEMAGIMDKGIAQRAAETKAMEAQAAKESRDLTSHARALSAMAAARDRAQFQRAREYAGILNNQARNLSAEQKAAVQKAIAEMSAARERELTAGFEPGTVSKRVTSSTAENGVRSTTSQTFAPNAPAQPSSADVLAQKTEVLRSALRPNQALNAAAVSRQRFEELASRQIKSPAEWQEQAHLEDALTKLARGQGMGYAATGSPKNIAPNGVLRTYPR